MFKISLSDTGNGIIQINDFCERFVADLSFWTSAQYREHWKVAAKELNRGSSVSFITSITEPEKANFINSWCCYLINGELVFQEHIIFLEQLNQPFDLEYPHRNVSEYEAVDDKGVKISEWRTSADKI